MMYESMSILNRQSTDAGTGVKYKWEREPRQARVSNTVFLGMEQ